MGQTQPVTDGEFETEVLNSSTPVLVDFWAEWCGPCKAIAPTLEELAGDYGERLKVVKVDIDENQQKAQQYNIRSIPSSCCSKTAMRWTVSSVQYPKAS